ncbi:MAG: histidine kinase dimerization/phospho-acceptor domain-containing protein [Verrucomicrobiales bacterium]|nr:histidine kinase dimerization/phospho-acceptor domain-containing protein [Verrucomicrobiales bacterium]
MKSIRRHFLSRLLPGFFLLWFGACLAVYFSFKNAWERRLESELREIADVLPVGNRGDADSFLRLDDIAEGDVGIYFRIWGSNGERFLKSQSLGQFDMVPPPLFSRKGEFGNQALESGDDVKTLALRINDTGGLGEINLLVAKSREESSERMTTIVIGLLILGLGGAGIFTLLLTICLKTSLMPLEKVGDMAMEIDAESMGARFPHEDTPSELEPIVGKLNDLLTRLEMSFERERRFSDDLAHEFRNPVAALKSIAEGALEWPEETPEENFRDIKSISEELQFTIENMLTLARIEKRKNRITSEPVNLQKVVEECWQLCSGISNLRKVTARIEIPPDLVIDTDLSLLRVLLSNLITNAADYCPVGSEIVIKPDDEAFFTISNPAPHLKPDDLPLMFDRLWRHDEARTDSSHCGLGLSVAKTCAEALALDLDARLSPDGVITFIVSEEYENRSSSEKVGSNTIAG